MAYRNIVVQSPASISTKNSQLVIKTDCEHSLAIEDISALLLESRQSTISTAALARLGEAGCAVFFCDERHIPCAVTVPYFQHSRQLEVMREQLAISEPLKKRLWQSIVISKITNQAECLKLLGKNSESEYIKILSTKVRSGDPDNIEAVAAAKYFRYLFGNDFTRSCENIYNSALNYGYAVVRGCMARYLSVYGFLPAFGLHHRSELNAFNLADDMMEPFRPLVDLLVALSVKEDDELSPAIKRLLFNCLNLDILSDGQHHSAAYAMERCVKSLSSSIRENSAELLLPQLSELKQHRYE